MPGPQGGPRALPTSRTPPALLEPGDRSHPSLRPRTVVTALVERPREGLTPAILPLTTRTRTCAQPCATWANLARTPLPSRDPQPRRRATLARNRLSLVGQAVERGRSRRPSTSQDGGQVCSRLPAQHDRRQLRPRPKGNLPGRSQTRAGDHAEAVPSLPRGAAPPHRAPRTTPARTGQTRTQHARTQGARTPDTRRPDTGHWTLDTGQGDERRSKHFGHR
jgi:hypothetical protein